MKTDIKKNLLHDGFLIGIYIKGFDGILEILGGFLLMLTSPVRLSKIILLLTQHELSEDPNDMIANYLIKISHEFTASSQHFGIFYLLSHGVVKIFLVAMLLEKRLWAYPLAVIFLVLFVGYQIYRYSYTHSFWLIALTVFDTVMILLTWIEHNRIKDIYLNKA